MLQEKIKKALSLFIAITFVISYIAQAAPYFIPASNYLRPVAAAKHQVGHEIKTDLGLSRRHRAGKRSPAAKKLLARLKNLADKSPYETCSEIIEILDSIERERIEPNQEMIMVFTRLYSTAVREHGEVGREFEKDLRHPRLSKGEITTLDDMRHKMHILAERLSKMLPRARNRDEVMFDIELAVRNLGKHGLSNIAVQRIRDGRIKLILPTVYGEKSWDGLPEIDHMEDVLIYHKIGYELKKKFSEKVLYFSNTVSADHREWCWKRSRPSIILPTCLLDGVVKVLIENGIKNISGRPRSRGPNWVKPYESDQEEVYFQEQAIEFIKSALGGRRGQIDQTRIGKAIEALEDIKGDGTRIEALVSIADAQIHLGQSDQAKATLKQALEIIRRITSEKIDNYPAFQKYIKALVSIAIVQAKLGENEESNNMFKKTLAMTEGMISNSKRTFVTRFFYESKIYICVETLTFIGSAQAQAGQIEQANATFKWAGKLAQDELRGDRTRALNLVTSTRKKVLRHILNGDIGISKATVLDKIDRQRKQHTGFLYAA